MTITGVMIDVQARAVSAMKTDRAAKMAGRRLEKLEQMRAILLDAERWCSETLGAPLDRGMALVDVHNRAVFATVIGDPLVMVWHADHRGDVWHNVVRRVQGEHAPRYIGHIKVNGTMAGLGKAIEENTPFPLAEWASTADWIIENGGDVYKAEDLLDVLHVRQRCNHESAEWEELLQGNDGEQILHCECGLTSDTEGRFPFTGGLPDCPKCADGGELIEVTPVEQYRTLEVDEDGGIVARHTDTIDLCGPCWLRCRQCDTEWQRGDASDWIWL